MTDMLRYVHVRPSSRKADQRFAQKGGITLAYTMPARHGDKMIWVAAAVCSKNDTYSKKRGRELAKLKFERGEKIQICTSKDLGIGTQLNEAFYPLVRLAVPYDNEEKNYGRMRQGRPAAQVGGQHRVQGVEPAGDQQEAQASSGC